MVHFLVPVHNLNALIFNNLSPQAGQEAHFRLKMDSNDIKNLPFLHKKGLENDYAYKKKDFDGNIIYLLLQDWKSKGQYGVDEQETTIYVRIPGKMFSFHFIRVLKHTGRIAGMVCR